MSTRQTDRDCECLSVHSLKFIEKELSREVGGRDSLMCVYYSTCLMLAAAEGHREVVETLREAKADPEPRDLSGLSAVDLALRNGHQQ